MGYMTNLYSWKFTYIMYINPNSGSAKYSRNRVLEIISSEDGGEPDHYYARACQFLQKYENEKKVVKLFVL